MTHIILLDGKLWAFEPPEKPYQNRTEGIPTISKSWDEYDRAYSLALEQKLEVEKDCYTKSHGVSRDGECEWEVITIGNYTFSLSENESIKWECGFTVSCDRHCPVEDCCYPHSCARVVRLIAQVKEENSAMSFTEGSEADDPLSISGHIYRPPVPSEQENQDEMWEEVKRIIWNHGFDHVKERFSITRNNNRP